MIIAKSTTDHFFKFSLFKSYLQKNFIPDGIWQ